MAAVTNDARRDAALLALINARPSRTPVAAVVAEIRESGDPVALWRERHPEDLFGESTDDVALTLAARDVAQWRSARYRFVSILDDRYPAQLRAVFDAPPLLFFRGDLSLVGAGGVSLVGSRAASDEGLRVASEIAKYLVSQEIPVLSGLAYGIDTAAHEATLDAGGVPIGVIATGIDSPYTPARNRDLHERVAQAGALVSQFQPTAPAMRHTFIQRNATMSGLGFATIVVEAGEHSGARAQARLAMEHGRPVLLTASVVDQTEWGAALADGRRANVHVVSNMADVRSALAQIQTLSDAGTLERLLAAASL